MKLIKLFGLLIVLISLFVATYFGYINSDNSWYAIIGREIASGNIFLNNWVGSTINHTFPYGIIEAFWSLFVHNYRIVHAFSIVTLVGLLSTTIWFAVKGLRGKTPSFFIFLIPALIISQMDVGYLADFFAHAAPLILTLTSATLYYCFSDNKYTKYVILFLLTCWTDNYNIAYFLIPIVLENILFFIKTKKIDSMLKWVVYGLVIYEIRHLIFWYIGMHIPGPGGVVGPATHMFSFNEILHRLGILINEYTHLWSSNLFSDKIVDLIPSLLFMVAMLLSLSLLCINSVKIYKKKSFDKNRFMIFLIIGIGSIFWLQLFSKMPVAARYLCGPFINSIIILCVLLDYKYQDSEKKLARIFVLFMAFSLCLQYNLHRYELNKLLVERQEIAKIIKDEHLHNGYAWFGNSLSTNFVLNEQRVISISSHHKSQTGPMLWMINKRWFYLNNFDFIIGWKDRNSSEWGVWDLKYEEMCKYFGNPKKVKETDRVRIYIYNDISNKVKKPKLDE